MANINHDIFNKANHAEFWAWLESDTRTPLDPSNHEETYGKVLLRSALSDEADIITEVPRNMDCTSVYGIWDRTRKLYLPVNNFGPTVLPSAVQDLPFSDIGAMASAVNGLAKDIILERVNVEPVAPVCTDSETCGSHHRVREQYIRSSRDGEPDGQLKASDLGEMPRLSWFDYAEGMASHTRLAQKQAEAYINEPVPSWMQTDACKTEWDSLLRKRTEAVQYAADYTALTENPAPEWTAAKAIWDALDGLEAKNVKVAFLLDGEETVITEEREKVMRQIASNGYIFVRTPGGRRSYCDVRTLDITRITFRGKAVYERPAAEGEMTA